MEKFKEKLIDRWLKELGWLEDTLLEENINEPAEEHKDGWIPCSERLPKANIVVLVYLKKCYKDKTYYSYDEAYVNEKGYWADEFGLVWGTVLAWQPLPEPYKYEEVNK